MDNSTDKQENTDDGSVQRCKKRLKQYFHPKNLTLSKKFEITYIDIHSALENKEGKLHPNYTYDGLHLTGEGYVIWKRQIRDYVN